MSIGIIDGLIFFSLLSASLYQVYLARTKQQLLQESKKSKGIAFLVAALYMLIFYLAFFKMAWLQGLLTLIISFLGGLFIATFLSRFIPLKKLKFIGIISMCLSVIAIAAQLLT